MLAAKDEKLSDLETKFQDQSEDLKNLKKAVNSLKSENKKNVDKLSK